MRRALAGRPAQGARGWGCTEPKTVKCSLSFAFFGCCFVDYKQARADFAGVVFEANGEQKGRDTRGGSLARSGRRPRESC